MQIEDAGYVFRTAPVLPTIKFAKKDPPKAVAPSAAASVRPGLVDGLSTRQQQAFVRQSLTLYPSETFTDPINMLKLIYTVSAIFEKNAEGLNLLHAENLRRGYDELKWVTKNYHKANNMRGFGSYITDLKLTATPACNRLYKQVANDTPVEITPFLDDDDVLISPIPRPTDDVKMSDVPVTPAPAPKAPTVVRSTVFPAPVIVDDVVGNCYPFVAATIRHIETLDDDIVCAISRLYRKSAQGLELLTAEFARRHQPMEPETSALYNNPSNNGVGFGFFVSQVHNSKPALCGELLEVHLPDMDYCEILAAEKVRIDDVFDAQFVDRCPDEHLYDLMQAWYIGAEGIIDDDFDPVLSALKLRIVRIMNRFHAVIRKQTKVQIIEETPGDPEKKFIMRSIADAKEAYITFGIGPKKIITPMTWWLTHHKARTFDKIVFNPANTHGPRELNLFRGLAIPREEAVAGDITPLLDHIKTIWCKGNQEQYDYALNWMAHLIQKIGVKMGTCLVVKGRQGAGKGCVIQLLAKIIGDRYFHHVQDMNTILGNFNSEEELTNLLAFIDECIFSGDPKQAQKLKTLVTEHKRKYEAKYVQAVSVANHSNYMIASNFDTCISKESDDRRSVCYEVDETYSGVQTPEIKAYFDIVNGIDPRHLAHFLYNRDISNFNPRFFPSTEYGRYQKQISLNPSEAFIDHWIKEELPGATPRCSCSKCIDEGEGTICKLEEHGGENTFTMDKDELWTKYEEFQRTRPAHIHAVPRATLFKTFIAIFKKLTEHKPSKKNSYGKRPKILLFPCFVAMKAAFALHMKEPEWYAPTHRETVF
jgi:hypothetical protein